MIDTDAASECAQYIKLRLVPGPARPGPARPDPTRPDPARPPLLMAFCWCRRLSMTIARGRLENVQNDKQA
jgi:hypothetical protein